MGRKRHRLKRRVIRRNMGKMLKGSPPKSQHNPFDAPWFWLGLATIDFYKALGIEADSTEGQPPKQENN